MAVRITRGGAAENSLPPSRGQHPQVVPAQMEVFGRLRLSLAQIADYYGITRSQINGLMRRSDLRTAYDRGRAETVVAVRQTQLKVALGSTRTDPKTGEQIVVAPPNPQMLIHAGVMFGDQTKDGVVSEPEDFEPSRFSWDHELRDRLKAARDRYTGTDE